MKCEGVLKRAQALFFACSSTSALGVCWNPLPTPSLCKDPASCWWWTKAYGERNISIIRNKLFQPDGIGKGTMGAEEMRRCSGEAGLRSMWNISAATVPTGLQCFGLLLWNGTNVTNNLLHLNKLLVGVCSFFQWNVGSLSLYAKDHPHHPPQKKEERRGIPCFLCTAH